MFIHCDTLSTDSLRLAPTRARRRLALLGFLPLH